MFKKYLGCFACFILLSVCNVNALSLNSEDNYVNKKGVIISREEYDVLSNKYNDGTIDLFDNNLLNYLYANDSEISQSVEYSITTDVFDSRGNYIESRTMSSTKEQALSIINNKNLLVTNNNTLLDSSLMCEKNDKLLNNANNYIYSTNSKQVRLSYSYFIDDTVAIIDAKWFTQPTIKQFDVLAIRWNTSRPLSNVIYGEGYQETSNGYRQDYYLDDQNSKRTMYGIGEFMNLFNNGRDFEVGMYYTFDDDVGEIMYGTYQHARNSNANTLAISKSYTFSSNGLGNVLYFSNNTYRNYYDGMNGVVDTLSSGCQFDCD